MADDATITTRPGSDGGSGASTLLLRLAGPLQSWGISSRYASRDTGSEPSKSGVIGLLAAALGLPRDTDLSQAAIGPDGRPFDLTRLRMGVRVDNEGVPGYDFQTVGGGDDHPGIAQARDTQRTIGRRLANPESWRGGGKGAISISNRYFLQDAVFLVGLEGDDRDALRDLDLAVRQPVFPLGLGRRSYVPSCPVGLPGGGVRALTVARALGEEPWPIDGRTVRPDWRSSGPRRLRTVIEVDPSEPDQVQRGDHPQRPAGRGRLPDPRLRAARRRLRRDGRPGHEDRRRGPRPAGDQPNGGSRMTVSPSTDLASASLGATSAAGNDPNDPLYLSRLRLNLRHPRVMRTLGDAQALHQLVMALFPAVGPGAMTSAEARSALSVLYRVDEAQPIPGRPEPTVPPANARSDAGADADPVLIVQSGVRPDLVGQAGQADRPAWAAGMLRADGPHDTDGPVAALTVRDVGPAYAAITAGQRLGFRLRANPTRRLSLSRPDEPLGPG